MPAVLLLWAGGAQAAFATEAGCWEHVVDTPGKSSNRLSVCLSEREATLEVFYPNSWWRLIPPTTCTAIGTGSATPAGAIAFAFPEGTCGNGETLKPARLQCDRTGADLICTYQGKRLEFARTRAQP